MIELSQKLCAELDITYWQLNNNNINSIQTPIHRLSRDEKELLRKILLAKGITLTDDLLEVQEGGVVTVNLNNYQLIFADVKKSDGKKIINLAKISDMFDSPEQKKLTWFKLKNIDL